MSNKSETNHVTLTNPFVTYTAAERPESNWQNPIPDLLRTESNPYYNYYGAYSRPATTSTPTTPSDPNPDDHNPTDETEDDVVEITYGTDLLKSPETKTHDGSDPENSAASDLEEPTDTHWALNDPSFRKFIEYMQPIYYNITQLNFDQILSALNCGNLCRSFNTFEDIKLFLSDLQSEDSPFKSLLDNNTELYQMLDSYKEILTNIEKDPKSAIEHPSGIYPDATKFLAISFFPNTNHFTFSNDVVDEQSAFSSNLYFKNLYAQYLLSDIVSTLWMYSDFMNKSIRLPKDSISRTGAPRPIQFRKKGLPEFESFLSANNISWSNEFSLNKERPVRYNVHSLLDDILKEFLSSNQTTPGEDEAETSTDQTPVESASKGTKLKLPVDGSIVIDSTKLISAITNIIDNKNKSNIKNNTLDNNKNTDTPEVNKIYDEYFTADWGDDINSIAEKYHISPQELIDANKDVPSLKGFSFFNGTDNNPRLMAGASYYLPKGSYREEIIEETPSSSNSPSSQNDISKIRDIVSRETAILLTSNPNDEENLNSILSLIENVSASPINQNKYDFQDKNLKRVPVDNLISLFDDLLNRDIPSLSFTYSSDDDSIFDLGTELGISFSDFVKANPNAASTKVGTNFIDGRQYNIPTKLLSTLISLDFLDQNRTLNLNEYSNFDRLSTLLHRLWSSLSPSYTDETGLAMNLPRIIYNNHLFDNFSDQNLAKAVLDHKAQEYVTFEISYPEHQYVINSSMHNKYIDDNDDYSTLSQQFINPDLNYDQIYYNSLINSNDSNMAPTIQPQNNHTQYIDLDGMNFGARIDYLIEHPEIKNFDYHSSSISLKQPFAYFNSTITHVESPLLQTLMSHDSYLKLSDTFNIWLNRQNHNILNKTLK